MADPLVLLPDILCDSRFFGSQIALFGSERGIFVPDLSSVDTIESLAEFVLERSPQRFALLGAGLGGVVAMEIATTAADRLSGLCLMTTSALPETPVAVGMRERSIVKAQIGDMDYVNKEWVRKSDLAQGDHQSVAYAELQQMAADFSPYGFVNQCRALQRRGDYQDTVRSISVPTLVMCGDADRRLSVRTHELLAGLIPRAVLTVIHDAGRAPTLEQSQRTNDGIRDWLRMIR